MRRTFFLIIILIILKPCNILGDHRYNHKFGIEFFAASILWENNYLPEKFENVGPVIFIVPNFEKRFKCFLIKLNADIGLSRLDGPDGLTITGPDDDIDRGFRTKMNTGEIVLGPGWAFSGYTTLFFNMKYRFFRLDGGYTLDPLRYKYIEKGFMFGPAIKIELPVKKTLLFFNYSFYMGSLATDYTPASFPGTYPNDKNVSFQSAINMAVHSGEIGLLISIIKDMHLGISYRYEYHKRSGTAYRHNPTDSQFSGLTCSLNYYF